MNLFEQGNVISREKLLAFYLITSPEHVLPWPLIAPDHAMSDPDRQQSRQVGR